MSGLIIRNATMEDMHAVKNLYLDSAEHYPDNLIPLVSEITDSYIASSLSLSIETGFAIVAEKEGRIIGYIQGYPSKNTRECHLIKDTRVIIHSQYNSSGYAIKLMTAVRERMRRLPYIKSLLFNVRGHNTASARGLKFFGCYEVYRYQDALLKCDGTFMDDVIYRWDNPSFSTHSFQPYWNAIRSGRNYKVYVDGFKEDMTWLMKTSNALRYPS